MSREQTAARPARRARSARRRVLLAALIALCAVLSALPASAGESPFGGTPTYNTAVCGSRYVPVDLGHGNYFNVYNEPLGASCIRSERHALSWYITGVRSNADLWGYPNISSGIEWGKYTCYDGRSASPSSPGSRCMRYPVQEKRDGTPLTSVTYFPHLVQGNVSYDIWFNKEYVKPSALQQDDGAEIMIWLNHTGLSYSPSHWAWRVELEGAWYDVMTWTADHNGKTWNYVAYVAQRQTRTLKPTWLNYFFRNAVAHGLLSPDWWLTSIDFGTEIDRVPSSGPLFDVKSYALTGVR